MPDTADHSASLTNWGNYCKTRHRKLSTELIIRRFLLYRIRFVFATDICQGWIPFGGLSAQLNHASIVLNLSIVETVGIALSYRASLFSDLPEKARHRADSPSEFLKMLTFEQPELREQAERGVSALATKKPAEPKAPAPKKHPKPKAPPKKQPRRSDPHNRSRPRKRSRSPPMPKEKKRRNYGPQRRNWAPVFLDLGVTAASTLSVLLLNTLGGLMPTYYDLKTFFHALWGFRTNLSLSSSKRSRGIARRAYRRSHG